MVEAYVALGSNIGDREANIRKAIALLVQKVNVIEASNFYETKPMYLTEQGWFVNTTVKIQTDLSPRELLSFLKGVEKAMGRLPVERNGPRIIDLDILFYDGTVVNEGDLHVPHPKIAERAFVLVPLTEIAPDFIHPNSGKTVTQLLAELQYDRSTIKRLGKSK